MVHYKDVGLRGFFFFVSPQTIQQCFPFLGRLGLDLRQLLKKLPVVLPGHPAAWPQTRAGGRGASTAQVTRGGGNAVGRLPAASFPSSKGLDWIPAEDLVGPKGKLAGVV
eukprot:TRINITY_DN941_c0_g1_i1.p1 TRINITY_DN941_c0_g1~~TRINITY_DN941_c0_g1_i1.p1  ORF type:complete len:110 (-),score=9.56 TRINITY_DN941_c0_g1_i1:241-570(-)